MSKLAIKAENISKQYRLGEVGTGTISHDLNRFWNKIRGKEDPYLTIGAVNNRAVKSDSDYVWSLKDINFEINQGDAVGIIGRNGAGKSTLLKLLSKVTKPTTGSFKVNGRIASLLEVGTGFNPEMTGRENIYLNGAILGMRKYEIDRKFDEIVDFSGVERYIDTPVKRYSSGMYVRLAFAVAAHLESEILIVDEVLAVGDAEFQKKCLGKMGDVSKGEGRTVLFVSHNMAAVKQLCNNGILLDNGLVSFNGNIDESVNKYLQNQDDDKHYFVQSKNNDINHVVEAFFSDESGNILDFLNINQKVFLNFRLNVAENNDLQFGFTLLNQEGIPILSSAFSESFSTIDFGVNVYRISIPISILKKGLYTIEGALWTTGQVYEQNDNYLTIKIISDRIIETRGTNIKGLIFNNNKWEKIN